jgi:hypothetical protein
MDETVCKYVGSFAILKTATHRSPPISDYDNFDNNVYLNLVPGSILHVCSQALPKFVKSILPTISTPFKLITNNSDCTLPNDFQNESDVILNNQYLIHWFSQNWVGYHLKVTRIPIGLDYHSLRPTKEKRLIWEQPERNAWGIKKQPIAQEYELLQIKDNSRPFWDREMKGYANFHFAMTMGYAKTDRPDALNTIPRDLVFYQPAKVTRDICWKNMVKHAFIVSPHGNGLDCHRTWEALALGCIPIVKSSGIDPLFDELPVWIVHNWTEVTLENMKRKVDEFKDKMFNYKKLTLAYWKSKIINT